MTTLERVIKVVSQNTGVAAAQLTAETTIESLCTDSLEVVSLNQDLEEEFKKDFEQWFKTIGSIVAYVDGE